jgi:uncharacterized SAM-binding protein YcdF (DUF218 family)
MAVAVEPAPAPSPRGRRPRRWLDRLVRTAVIVLGLAVLYLLVTFVQVYRASTHDGAREADAIIVLGAAQYGGRPSPVLQARLDQALRLYEAELAPLIVLTGGNQEGDEFTEANTGYRYLLDKGVPLDALKLEDQGTSTWDSLRAVARFMLPEGGDRVVLVTSDYHAYRVEAIAEDVGFDATVSPSDSLMSGTHQLGQLLRETGAVAVGRIIGYDRLFRIDHAVND